MKVPEAISPSTAEALDTCAWCFLASIQAAFIALLAWVVLR